MHRKRGLDRRQGAERLRGTNWPDVDDDLHVVVYRSRWHDIAVGHGNRLACYAAITASRELDGVTELGGKWR